MDKDNKNSKTINFFCLTFQQFPINTLDIFLNKL